MDVLQLYTSSWKMFSLVWFRHKIHLVRVKKSFGRLNPAGNCTEVLAFNAYNTYKCWTTVSNWALLPTTSPPLLI